MQAFAFEELEEHSYTKDKLHYVKKWRSANVFSDTKQKHVCRENFKSERLLAVLREHIIFNVK